MISVSQMIKDSGLSCEKIAKVSGYSEEGIRKLRNGSRQPMLNTYIDLAQVFGYEVCLKYCGVKNSES